MSSPRSVRCDSKCYPVMAEAFKSILHFKRTCLAAELKGLCQLQVSQQLLFARDADEECPCSLRRGWLRGSPCGMTVPGSDGRPGFYSSTCVPPNASCAVQGGGGAIGKGSDFCPNVAYLWKHIIFIAILERNMHLKIKFCLSKFLICFYIISALWHCRNSKEGRGGNARAAIFLQIFYFKRAKEHAQRIHLHFNKHFLCLVVSFSHLLPARKTSSVWLWHPCLMQAAAQTTWCLLGTVNFQLASLALRLRKKWLTELNGW